jgi:hypothetical protein
LGFFILRFYWELVVESAGLKTPLVNCKRKVTTFNNGRSGPKRVCNMRQRLFLFALLAIGLALPFTGKAAATGCCGYTGWPDYYVPYAEQPVSVVIRPIVVPQPYYLSEYVPCGDGLLVNQGQYHTNAAVIAQSPCFLGYAPVHRSKVYYK